MANEAEQPVMEPAGGTVEELPLALARSVGVSNCISAVLALTDEQKNDMRTFNRRYLDWMVTVQGVLNGNTEMICGDCPW